MFSSSVSDVQLQIVSLSLSGSFLSTQKNEHKQEKKKTSVKKSFDFGKTGHLTNQQ